MASHNWVPPSLTALRAFETAARTLSFTGAADELNQTQGAISHQVNTLEARLGVRLFEREARGLKLTEVCKLIPRNITIQRDGTVVIRSPGHRQVATRTLAGPPPKSRRLRRLPVRFLLPAFCSPLSRSLVASVRCSPVGRCGSATHSARC